MAVKLLTCNHRRDDQRYDHRRKPAVRWGCCALMTVVVMGCSGKYGSRLAGKVSYDGTPLDRGTVSFYPVAGGAPAYGRIQSDGSFELRTGGGGGLVAGEYQVAVQSVERIPGKSDNQPPTAKSLIPLQYKDANTSGMTYTVKPGKNEFEIDLPAIK